MPRLSSVLRFRLKFTGRTIHCSPRVPERLVTSRSRPERRPLDTMQRVSQAQDGRCADRIADAGQLVGVVKGPSGNHTVGVRDSGQVRVRSQIGSSRRMPRQTNCSMASRSSSRPRLRRSHDESRRSYRPPQMTIEDVHEVRWSRLTKILERLTVVPAF